MYIFLIYLPFFILAILLLIFYFYTFYAFAKGAPFVPTNKKRVKRMIKLSGLKEGETMMDFGSGDGRIVIEGSRTGAKCTGIEINPTLFWWSKIKLKLKKAKNAEIRRENLWKVDLSDVDVLTLFFIAPKMDKLSIKIKREMKPGSRVVSYAFKFPNWQYSEKDGKIYLYEV